MLQVSAFAEPLQFGFGKSRKFVACGMDAAIESLVAGELVTGSRESARLTGMADRNLTQGLGVIHDVLIQQAGGVADDAATMSALRTSIHVPTGDSP